MSDNISLSGKVFDALENEILTGVLERGETLSENKISARLGVSRTPVREALQRLEQEGLVKTEPGKGAVVLGISQGDLLDIYEIRIRIEGLAARYAARNITDAQVREMLDVVELQEFFAAKGDSKSLRDLDSKFHSMIYKFCTSRILTDTLNSLHHKIERFRRMSVEIGGRGNMSVTEHREIVEALAARDEERAENLLIEHIKNARAKLLEVVEEQNVKI